MSTDTQSNAPPPPSSVLFARGVIARLALWPALQIAVGNGWGGPESHAKRTWLASVLVDAFESQTPTPDTLFVEDTLLQVMSDEFETVLEDGSAEAVAEDVVKLWEDACVGHAAGVEELERRVAALGGRGVQAVQAPGGCDDDDDSDDGEEDEEEEEDGEDGGEDDAIDEDAAENNEVPQLIGQHVQARTEPVVDEDGFTLVQAKSRQR
jgi:pre-rRNA-processing protein TSR2